MYMFTTSTQQFLNQYDIITELMVDIEMSSRIQMTNNKEVANLKLKLKPALATLDDIYQDFSPYPPYEGGIDKRILKSNLKLMMFLYDYLPHIAKDIDERGGTRKQTSKKRKTKRNVLKNRKLKSRRKSTRSLRST